jgi:hypothetical protein
VNCRCTTASFTVLPEPTGYPSGSLRRRCGVPTYPGVPAFYDVSVPFGKSAPTSAHRFAAGFLSLRQAAPTDPPSRERPCLRLVVVVSRLRYLSSIWTLVLRQGTFTPLVHALAGRTQLGWSGLSRDLGHVVKRTNSRSTGTLYRLDLRREVDFTYNLPLYVIPEKSPNQ